jgi:hypothetical protein
VVLLTENSFYFREFTLNNICNLTCLELGKIKNVNIRLFFFIFFLSTKYFVCKSSDFVLDNPRVVTVSWAGMMPCETQQKAYIYCDLFFNSTVVKKTILTWSGTLKQLISFQ